MAHLKRLPVDPEEPSRPDEPATMDDSALRSSHPALRTAVINIGLGWHALVRELFEQLPRNVIASRITEKDGELQVVLVGRPEGSDEALWRAAELSRYTCVVCGEPGEVVVRRGWMKAVCELHATAWTPNVPVTG